METITDKQMEVLCTEAGELQLAADELRVKRSPLIKELLQPEEWNNRVKIAAIDLKNRCQSMIKEIDHAYE